MLFFIFEFLYQLKFSFLLSSLFKLFSENIIIKNHFSFKKDGVLQTYPKTTFLGVMYIFIQMPHNLIINDYNDYLNAKLEMLNELILENELIGLFRVDTKIISVEDKEDKYVLVKYYPIFTFMAFFKFIIFLAVLITMSILTYNYYAY